MAKDRHEHPPESPPVNAGASMTFGALLLAAGASRRMGRPKLLLPWGNGTVLAHLLRVWQNAGARQLAVVCATENRALLDELDRLEFPSQDRIVNPAPERGMFSSIQCAANWAGWDAELTHHVIVLGDQPHLQTHTLRALLEFAADHPDSICQPLRQARPRHPVVLPKTIFRAAGNSGARDLKEFLRRHATARAGFDAADPGLDLDLDTPEDYERARRLYAGDE